MNQNTKTALIIGGVALGLLIAVPQIRGGISGWQGGDWGMMGPGMMGGFGWGWFMPVFMILFWGLVIWAVVALVRGAANLTWGIPALEYSHNIHYIGGSPIWD